MFVSYAQNFEDVILWRALKHVEKGFYVDIGAQDPIIDSVSRSFYEKGWRGIHVEPTATYAAKLRENRPDEETIQVAIGSGSSSITFYEIPETGLSTGDKEIAETHKEHGHTVLETTVPLLPLSTVLDSIGKREIHWLKIDVEGMEESVIDSWLPATARPWVVVVESTFPNSQEPTHARWEVELVQLGYNFVYFDGLSRYYVSDQHRELSGFFGPGPNFFDSFVLADTSVFVKTDDTEKNELARQVKELEEGLRSAKSSANDIKSELTSRVAEFEGHIRHITEALRVAQSAANDSKKQAHEWWVTAENLRSELDIVYSSRSWRMTSSARRIMDMARRISLLPKKMARVFLEHSILWLGRRPRLQGHARRLISLIPAIEKRLISFSRSRLVQNGAGADQRNLSLVGDLSPKARKIYQDINAKLEE